MWQSLVGSRSRPVVNWVERGAVRKFAEAIGDPNPLYLDEEAAKKSRYGRLIAPPTFPQTFDYGTIEGLRLPDSGLIHGEQRFDYVRPLFVGEEITCCRVFQDMYEKTGSRGKLVFLVFSRVGQDSGGRTLFTTKDVIIVTETVMKEWKG
ncbi:MaoC dehydratase-like protein [Planifilum fimeticola]|jgi:acyl dehydratase|uniref:MaoC dehydratase-like protein n=1 Tax=Planifilum fimeticola TaxID=201975 RepID=A0A2T0LFP8_9BACL|nr:MaoC family dehydratase N-terminal domain-containing protein [Planifilum fimeticola]PRX41013.1 MaoC dehydratase-like protein [Planifilum fimeticola]